MGNTALGEVVGGAGGGAPAAGVCAGTPSGGQVPGGSAVWKEDISSSSVKAARFFLSNRDATRVKTDLELKRTYAARSERARVRKAILIEKRGEGLVFWIFFVLFGALDEL